MKVKPTQFEGIFWIDKKLATINLIPGYRSANEELIKINDKEFRIWDPFTSKPSAAIKRGLKVFPLQKSMKILYLGIASAKTASFFSDIIGSGGIIYGVDIADRVLRDAIPVAERRGNIVCILGDGRKPDEYEDLILEKVDLVYEDVADPDMIRILIWNCQKFLKPKGDAMIAIKSQSIDVTKKPKEVYNECLKELEKHFEILDKVELDPFEKFHLFVVMRMK